MSNEAEGDLAVAVMLLTLIHPVRNVVEGEALGEVKHQQNTRTVTKV